MKKLLITHTWNDELYLRGWLRHHKPLFDHGVIIYYNSTDSTRAIIQEEAPDWSVVVPWTAKLTTGVLETQLQAIEDGYPGWWKTVLTATEYLLTDDLTKALESAPSDALLISGYGLVDCIGGFAYDPAIPVFKQRSYGFDMRKVEVPGRNYGRRLIHNRANGQYSLGRHWTGHKDAKDWDGLKLARAFYAPYNEAAIARKVGMGANISEKDVAEGRCWQHFWTREQIEADYQALLSQSGPLSL